VVRIQRGIAQELEYSTVQVVGAGFGGDVDDSAAEAPILRREAVALYFKLLGVVDRRDGSDLVKIAGGAGDSVDQNFVALRLAATDGEVGVPCGVNGNISELAIGGLVE